MPTVKVAAIQLSHRGSKDKNLKKAVDLIDQTMKSHKQMDLFCLPELFYLLPPAENTGSAAESVPNALTEAFSSKAREYGVYIIGGSFYEKRKDGNYNTSLLFDRSGEIIGSYSKTHLLDAFGFRESDSTIAGKELPVFRLDFAVIGITICYDLRFPEIYRMLALKGADIIFAPSAFLSTTLHWEILVKAAAVQNLVHMVGVNGVGEYKGISFVGRSMIVDPRGISLATAPDRECAIYAEINLDDQEELRRKICVLENRRPDLYKLT